MQVHKVIRTCRKQEAGSCKQDGVLLFLYHTRHKCWQHRQRLAQQQAAAAEDASAANAKYEKRCSNAAI